MFEAVSVQGFQREHDFGELHFLPVQEMSQKSQPESQMPLSSDHGCVTKHHSLNLLSSRLSSTEHHSKTDSAFGASMQCMTVHKTRQSNVGTTPPF